MAGGWRWGIVGVVAVLTVALAAVAAFDAYLEATGSPPIGARLQVWARRYPLFSAAVIVLVGAMLAHFFLNRGF
jgi:hypothetical protein